MAGPKKESRRQAGLGRGALRSGDALAQAAAPAEGDTNAKQEKGTGDAGGAHNEMDRVIDGLAIVAIGLKRPGAHQAG
jgi:hypothetical protein